jgi:hypothetical protein
MKPRWLAVLLVVSLAGNAVELALYARSKWRSYRWSQRFNNWVAAGAAVWNPHAVVPEFEPQVRELGRREDRWSVELEWQDYQTQPDTQIDRIALDSVASITRQRYELLYQSRRALSLVHDARLRSRMERRWRQQMGIGDR